VNNRAFLYLESHHEIIFLTNFILLLLPLTLKSLPLRFCGPQLSHPYYTASLSDEPQLKHPRKCSFYTSTIIKHYSISKPRLSHLRFWTIFCQSFRIKTWLYVVPILIRERRTPIYTYITRQTGAASLPYCHLRRT
jgi:hypothetical protein